MVDFMVVICMSSHHQDVLAFHEIGHPNREVAKRWHKMTEEGVWHNTTDDNDKTGGEKSKFILRSISHFYEEN